MPSSLPLAFPLHSQSPGLMHSQGEPHCPALGSLCPPPAARMALLCFWFASFCLPFFWVPGWPPFLSLPSGEGSKAFCQEEEHVPCHCCMHPGPVTLCASPAACGAGCQEGMGRTFQDRGSQKQGRGSCSPLGSGAGRARAEAGRKRCQVTMEGQEVPAACSARRPIEVFIAGWFL